MPILAGVRRFLERLRDKSVLPTAVSVGEFIEALPQRGASALLSTLDGSLFDQVRERLRRPVERLDIISPLNSDPSRVIATMRTAFPTQKFHLYTDADAVPRIRGIDAYWTLRRPVPGNEKESIQVLSQAHAKIYAFYQADLVDVFWGSANLSYSAWLAKGRAANIDLLVHSRVPSASGSVSFIPYRQGMSGSLRGHFRFRSRKKMNAKIRCGSSFTAYSRMACSSWRPPAPVGLCCASEFLVMATA